MNYLATPPETRTDSRMALTEYATFIGGSRHGHTVECMTAAKWKHTVTIRKTAEEWFLVTEARSTPMNPLHFYVLRGLPIEEKNRLIAEATRVPAVTP